MTKKLLVYNMPEDVLGILNKYQDKYEFETIEATKTHLNQKVGHILEDNIDENKENPELEHIDINFLMLHNFTNEELDGFLKDMKEESLIIPNKCISTDTNKEWILHDLLKENKEESELMPILHGLYSLRSAGEKILKNTEDKELEEGISKINSLIESKNFEKEEMRQLYNNVAKICNKHLTKEQ